MLALPLAAQAADYRAQLSESFNSGLAAARPSITLRAVIDNGGGGAPVPTGIVRFNVDTEHLTSSAWASMLRRPGAARSSARSSSELTGTSSVRVLSHGTDAERPVRARRHRRARAASPRSSATTTSSWSSAAPPRART